jgi:tetratricopeptide (TPR) repeat protein
MNYVTTDINSIKAKVIYSVLLFVISFAIYIPSLSHGFVWDDTSAVKIKFNYKSLIRSLKPNTIEKKSNYYRPTISLFYLIDSQLWNKNPMGYHLTNILLNSCVVFLLFWFIYYFFINLGYKEHAFTTAIISSFLFLAHPIHVESVSWVSARTDVLCTLFMMIGMLAHVKSSTNKIIVVAAFIAFYISMLSKELGILFLPIILVMDYATGEIKKRSSIFIYIVYILLILLYFYVRSQSHVNITHVSDKNVATVVTSDLVKYLEILKVLAITYYTYIYKILFPVELNAFIYDIAKDTYYVVGALLFILFTGILLIYSFIKKLPIIYISMFWFLLTLGPSSILSVIKMTPTSLAERYLYLPSIGFCLILGYICTRLISSQRYKIIGILTLIFILSFYSISTINRQKVWASDLTLWKDSSMKTEYACFPHNNYAIALRDAGKIKEAIKQYLYIYSPNIQCSNANKSLLYNNFGVALMDLNKTDLARERFEDSIRAFQYYFKPHMNLGVTYIGSAIKNNKSDDFKKAEYYLTNAIELNPSSGDSHHYLSIVYKETGDFKKAEIHARKAIKLGVPLEQKKDTLRILDEIQNSDFKED